MIAKDYNLRLNLSTELLALAEQRAAKMGYVDVTEYICSLIEVDLASHDQAASTGRENTTPLIKLIQEIGASVPGCEWAKAPIDLSKHLKHYLYGAPRETE